jgi:uncharacterized protein (DUF58 family)
MQRAQKLLLRANCDTCARNFAHPGRSITSEEIPALCSRDAALEKHTSGLCNRVNQSQEYFDPETLARIRPLGLRARTLVEGLVAGLHRSPLRGHSIEFAQHREYVAGDDLRQVDWKVYARSDRYYLKQYEDETNLIAYMLLDTSESMQYRGANSPLTKLEYAQLVVFSLAYLVITQQDSAALATFSAELDGWLPPSGSTGCLDDMVRLMETTAPRQRTDLRKVVELAAQRCSKPGVIVLVSDLLDDPQSLLTALKRLRYQRHDVIVVHVLDESELTFPFDRSTRFEGMEGMPEVVTDPLLIGGAYRRAMATFCTEIAVGCQQLGVDYHRLQTNVSLAITLPPLLARRLTQRS